MKLSNIFSILTGGALLLGLASCTDEVKYTPAPEVEGVGLHFSADFPAEYDLPANVQTVPVSVYRTNGTEELTVEVTGSITLNGEPATDVFTLPTSVTFAAGQSEAILDIAVDFEALEAEVEYELSLRLPEDGTPFQYGPSSLNSVLIYAPWSDYEEQEDYVAISYGTPFDGNYIPEWYWFKSVSLIDPLQWKVGIPAYFSNVPLELEVTINEHDENSFVNENNETCYYVTTPMMDCGYPADANPTYGLADYYSWCMWIYDGDEAKTLANMANYNMERSYYNSVSGLIVLNTQLFPYGEENKGYRYTDATGVWTIQLPGYTVPYIDIFDAGSLVDATGKETKLINIQKSSNIATMKYELLKGEVTGEAVEAAYADLTANEDIAATEENSVSLTYDIPYGMYTMIAVGYDSNKQTLTSESMVINYTGVQPASPWETIGYVNYTDGFMQSIDTEYGKITVKAEIQANKDVAGDYRLVNPYQAWVGLAEETGLAVPTVLPGNYYLYFNCADERMVYVKESCIGLQFDRTEGAVMVNSVAQQLLDEGKSVGQVRLKAGRLSNGIITFPINQLLIGYQKAPEWQKANVTQAFQIDMNSLTQEAPARLRGVKPATVNEKHQRVFTSTSIAE